MNLTSPSNNEMAGLYVGHHRANEMSKGTGLIPLGDRNRVKSTEIHLTGIAEEVNDVDRFSKWSTISH